MKRQGKACFHRGRVIVGDVMIALFLLLLLDVTVVMLRRIGAVVLKSTYQTIFHYELALCAVLLAFAFDVRFGFLTRARHRAAKAVGWVFRILIGVSACVILFYFGKIMLGGLAVSDASTDCAIVLGMALEDGKPTKDLLFRVDAARAYWESHPDSSLILTGGNAGESGKTEAEVMRELLSERGVPGGNMILEDRAKTTKENFADAAKLTDPSLPVVVITSDYHMDRAAKTARDAGFTRVLRLPARSDPLCLGANIMWEVILELKGNN